MERLYTIPLRREFQKVANYKRTSKAMRAIRQFIQKHMKCENVLIGKELNLELWKNGRKNPPPRIKVKAVKDKDKDVEFVIVNLPNVKIELPKDKKKEKKKTVEKPEVSKDEKQKEQDKEKKEVLEHKDIRKGRPIQSQEPLKVDMKPKEKRVIGRTSKK